MLETKEIFGRSESKTKKLGTKGCSYIGKNVSYPGGEYEEMGKAYLDIVSPHCMLIVGKRGTGKSYTLGVIAEGFARLKEKYSNNLSLVLIDTMSVFHSLKKENTNESEIELMDNFDIEPKSWKEDVKILVPEAAIKKARQNGEELHFDEILKIALSRVEVHEWLELFDLEITSSTGTLLSRVITELKKKGNFSFEDIYRRISDEGEVEESTKNSLKTLFEMIQKLDIFSKAGMDETMVEGGKITVLDISHLGRLGDYELRSLIVSIFAREQMAKRTLYTTVEMQAQAGLGEKEGVESITEEYPIVYMLIDEAHLFLPSEGTTLSTEPLLDWIKLGRHPGLSLIMATQEPSALHASAIKQSDMIIAHNMTAKGDLDALKLAKQSYMKEGLDEVVADMEFKRGLAMIFDDKRRELQMCRIRPRHTLHTGVDASALPPEERF
ncbi:MAG: ATP-binding protein [Candidatus Thermoplasmatota archaeon]|nr:ATP-binding protein [Candidatus Thermoplasmatota archaeon]